GEVEQLYRGMGLWPSDDPVNSESEQSKEDGPDRKPRARFGSQRYRINASIRALGRLSAIEVASRTGLSPRRVKDQLSKDVRLGILGATERGYDLTSLGRELIERFE